jgi:hypothetical protein
MAKQTINLGNAVNDGTGDALRVGAQKINANFTELYNLLGGNNIQIVSSIIAGPGLVASSPSGNVTITAQQASADTVGVVKIGAGITVSEDGTISSSIYTLPRAATNILGGIKVGNNLTINNEGVLSADAQNYVLPTASPTTKGGIQVGFGLEMVEGVLNAIPGAYLLPIASTTELGGIKVDGTSITINPSTGVISGANTYILPTASTTVLGGVKVDGTTITLNGSDQLVATSYSLPTASTTVLGGVKVDGTTITLNGSDQLVATSYSLPTASTTVLGGVKVDGTTITLNGSDQLTVTRYSRTPVQATTTSLANNATGNLTITGYKGYALYKIQTSAAAWIRIYTDSASRTADSSRDQTTDPSPGSGVIAEVITTGAETILISPGTIGFSNESTPSTDIQLAVTNKSGGTTTITVTLTVLQLEA